MTFVLRTNVSKFSIFSFFSRKCVCFWYCFHFCRNISIKLCVVQIGRLPPPCRGRVGTSPCNGALPSGHHTWYRPAYGIITEKYCPTHGISTIFLSKKVMSPPFPDRGMVDDRFEPHIKHLHFLIYSIATKLGRQVDGVDIYKLEQKIHNGAHIVLTSALFSFCKETPWYTLTQFLTSSFWGLSWRNQPKWMRALDSAFNFDENTT